MRRGSVAECFLDSLAARLESIRLGGGRGWRRFLVFAELTKSKKGAEYIALFTFFSFQCKEIFRRLEFQQSANFLSLDPRSSLLRTSPSHQRPHPLLDLQG